MMTPAHPINTAVDELPNDSVTVTVLKGLDFVVPGQWENVVGWDNTIRAVTGESDPARLGQIRENAMRLYNDSALGYQRTLWMYQTVDVVDMALATAALAQKASEKIPFLSFLKNLTPKADTTQSIDLALKFTVEALSFLQLQGAPTHQFGDFVSNLQKYTGASVMRLAALVCLDGLVPLGPDFVQLTGTTLSKLNPAELERNELFQRMSTIIPGGNSGAKLGFISQGFASAQGWMNGFVTSRGLKPEAVLGSLKQFVAIADDSLDYVGAFFDLTTNYYAHTGTQTVARKLIEKAAE